MVTEFHAANGTLEQDDARSSGPMWVTLHKSAKGGGFFFGRGLRFC